MEKTVWSILIRLSKKLVTCGLLWASSKPSQGLRGGALARTGVSAWAYPINKSLNWFHFSLLPLSIFWLFVAESSLIFFPKKHRRRCYKKNSPRTRKTWWQIYVLRRISLTTNYFIFKHLAEDRILSLKTLSRRHNTVLLL